MFSQRTLRPVSVVALFVLLWGLVFPTLANAGIGDTNAVWTEVCTAQGIKKVQQIQQTDDAHAPQAHAYSAEHCSLCCLGGTIPAAEPLALVDGLQLQYRSPQLPVAQVLLPQQIILLSAPPRAPPHLSFA